MIRQLQKIGNSKGVVLTRTMLEHLGVRDEIEITMEDGRIVLTAPQASSSHHQSFEEARDSTVAQYGDTMQRLANS